MSKCDERTLPLKDAIERLYLQFEPYSEWSKDPGCPCCVTEADLAPLLTKHLRDLTHRDLQLFGHLAATLWGDIDDYRHFLPRLLELCTLVPDESADDWDLEFILSILNLDKWSRWPEAEKDAVENFIDCWWQCTVLTSADKCSRCGENHSNLELDACAVLSAIARASEDIDRFLIRWRAAAKPTSWHKFAKSWDCLANIYLSGEPKKQFATWLADEQTLRWLERGLIMCAAEEWAEEYATEVAKVHFFNQKFATK